MEADFLQPQDPRWRSFLSEVQHDFYHLPGYLQLSSRIEGGSPCAFWARERECQVCIPLLIRSLPKPLGAPVDWSDALTPYGYPGPLFKIEGRELQSEEVELRLINLLEHFQACCQERNIVSVFCRLHPLLPTPIHSLQQLGEVVSHGETVYVDLALTKETLHSHIRRSYRKKIRQLQREGFQIVVDNFDYLKDFVTIYYDSMTRVKADNFYFFPESYFTELVDFLGNRVHLFSVISSEQELVCAILVTEVCGIMQGHLIGTKRGYFEKSLNKLVFYKVIEWGKEQGHSVFHLGGGVRGTQDSLYNFKAGFSDLRAAFRTWNLVVSAERYEELCSAGNAPKQEDGPGPAFFPAYRLE